MQLYPTRLILIHLYTIRRLHIQLYQKAIGIGLVWILLAACGNTPENSNLPTAAPTVPPATATTTNQQPSATATTQTVVVQRAQRATAEPGLLAARATPQNSAEQLPLLTAHLEAVRAAMTRPVPILPLTDGLDAQQLEAQQIALADPRFSAETREPQSGAPLRTEIFGIYPLRPGDITAETAACTNQSCYRVELYNYALNHTTIAIVALEQGAVIAINRLLETQPDLPPALTRVAQEIAANAPEVIDALGLQPAQMDATMANIKTALNASRCERSHHLCVAPTFLQDGRALWAIVDLTEATLVGVRWTELGAVAGVVAAPTEKELQDEVVSREFCEKSNALARNGWSFDYILTSSDGLRISDVAFQGKAVLTSAKLVDWHVSYSQKEGFGYSDAIGCPIFSQAAVVAFNGPKVETILANEQTVGFALIQDYKSEFWPAPCNYFYSQRYEFYVDGRFRIAFANHGRGCGTDGVYRPVVRIAPATATHFAHWDGATWQPWLVEQWMAPFAATTAEGFQYRLLSGDDAGYYMEPGHGQFADGGRGDNAYVYVTRSHINDEGADEGESDLVTIGPCCNTNYEQGPEKFIDNPTPESIDGAPLVIWYVAQLENDATPGQEYCWADAQLVDGLYIPIDYPCFAGPRFTPVDLP